MKRFEFGPERVRQWREEQVIAEEARLEQLFSEKSLTEQRLVVLEQEARESAAVVNRAVAADPVELRAIDAFRRFAIGQRQVIAGLIADCDRRIADQRQKLMEARRRAELLNRLKDRRWKTWNADLSREIENQAGELFLAKWTSSRR